MAATAQSLQAHFAPPVSSNWTRRAYHASAVVGDYVYIDMGEVAVGTVPLSSGITNATYTPYAINCTLTIPLHQSWTDPSTVEYSVIVKPEAPAYNFAALWYDGPNNSLYSFGGEESYLDSKEVDLAVWKLELDGGGGGTWTQNTTQGDAPFSQGVTRPLGGASTFDNQTAFYLGGYSSSHSSPQTQDLVTFVPTPGLIEYNFQNSSWTNSTAGITNISQDGSFEWGGMEYIPFGPNGLLVMWGGETSESSIYIPGAEEQPMHTVTLLDPITKDWYQQTIPGTVPSVRNRFCSVVASDPRPLSAANNTGTTEIFMYAGYAGVLGAGNEQYDEVWVLSIPAFSWQRVDASQKSARYGHTCHLVGGRQMLSIGGVDASQQDAWSTPDYTNINGLGVFDLVQNTWSAGYNASAAPYQRSQMVQENYDNNGAYPQQWTQPALQDLFMSTASSPTAISPTPTPTPTPHHHGLPPSTAALIAGATLGSLLGILLPFLLVCIYLRRKPPHHAPELSTGGEINKYELGGGGEVGKWKTQQRFWVELDGGGVAVEVGGGGGGGRTPTSMGKRGSLVKGADGRGTGDVLGFESEGPVVEEVGSLRRSRRGTGGGKSEYPVEKVGVGSLKRGSENGSGSGSMKGCGD